MNTASVGRIETLNKNNFDTWKMQMEALLVKNDAWGYVNGENVKPTPITGNPESEAAILLWTKNDSKAKSDIILSINPSELKQIKGLSTSRDVWFKLESIYQSKGPARKATLLKQLTLQRMVEGDDVREYTNKFFDAVDKLNKMNVEINPDLLAIMLLYSLPESFENFRCAIESRDELPSPEDLRVKIIEESDARKNSTRSSVQNAMYTNKHSYKRWNFKKEREKNETSKSKQEFKYRCHRCKQLGHKAADCNKSNKDRYSAKNAENLSLCVTEFSKDEEGTQQAGFSNQETKWCLDSGATSHLCNQANKFVEIDNSKYGKLNLASNLTTDIIAKGTVSFTAEVSGNIKNVSLNQTLHVPDLRTNLLSVGKITDHDLQVTFTKSKASVTDNKGNTKLIADRVGDLYYVREYKNAEMSESAQITKQSCNMLESWHRRLGHLNVKDLVEAVQNKTIQGVNLGKIEGELKCEICLRGKMTRNPFPKKSERKTSLLEIVHSDVCGPMSHGKSKYLITFIDDHSRWCEVRFLKSKNEALAAFKEFKSLVENQKEKRIKYLQSDNGTEYRNNEFDNYLKENGITRRLTVPYNPEQNGVAERKNRTLLDTARCLLMQSGLPSSFWAEAISTANYIRNRCPTKSLGGMTPFEAWTGRKPDVSKFEEFGSKVFILNNEPNRGKFESRSKEGIFLGYPDLNKGYKIWLPEQRKIVISRDVKFVSVSDAKLNNFEDFVPEIVNSENNAETNDQDRRVVEIEMIPLEKFEPEIARQEPNEVDIIRRGRGRPKKFRTCSRGRPPKQNHEAQCNTGEVKLEHCLMSEISIKKAMSGKDVEEWRDAMASELNLLLRITLGN